MRELQKALLICCFIHVALILVLVTNKIASMYNNPLFSVESWRMWFLFLMLCVVSITCMMLFRPQLERNLKRIDPALHYEVFKNGFADYTLFFAFSKKGDNNEVNSLKAYTRLYYALWLLCIVEGLLVLI